MQMNLYANASMCLCVTAPALFCCFEHYIEGTKMIPCRKITTVTDRLWGMRSVTLLVEIS